MQSHIQARFANPLRPSLLMTALILFSNSFGEFPDDAYTFWRALMLDLIR